MSTHANKSDLGVSCSLRELSCLLRDIPRARRGAAMQSVVSFLPNGDLEQEFSVGALRAAFANYWKDSQGEAVPIEILRSLLEPPIPIKTVLEFSRLNIPLNPAECDQALNCLLGFLVSEVSNRSKEKQLNLFEVAEAREEYRRPSVPGTSVETLEELLERERTFPTIYADPPWAYKNVASRAAAENHYQTMPTREICRLPISDLSEPNAHLHLWTTNGFLQDAFDVLDAWGFEFKSCLVWVKDEIGMGNYWRVSYEFLLLGVRGRLTFADRTMPSWLQAPRTVHSRKPGVIRSLIERVSPGPYLELFGREELLNSQWTVFGNQVERRLF